MPSLFRKYLIGISILLTSTLTAVSLSNAVSAVVDNDPDCDNVAIIRCGAFSAGALREKASQGDVPRVFNALDISQKDLEGKFVDGIVWRDGRVTVGGKTVATGAMTAGRNFGGTPIANTNNAGIYPTSKFVTEGQTAFVSMKADGTFDFAVIKACGNPVKATPKAEPKPEPKPEPTPQQVPKVECISLTAEKIGPTKYTFTARATMSGGATIEKYEFGFGDGNGVTVAENMYTYEYKQPGTFKTSVVVHFKANGTVKKVTSPACERVITVVKEQIEVCDLATKQRATINKTDFDATKHSLNFDLCKPPVTPAAVIKVCEIATKKTISIKDSEFDSTKHSKDVTVCKQDEVVAAPQVLAATGPEAIVAGLFGSSALGYGGFAYLQSRRNLLNKLLGR